MTLWSIKVSLFSSKIPSHACSAGNPLVMSKGHMCFINVGDFPSTIVRSFFFLLIAAIIISGFVSWFGGKQRDVATLQLIRPVIRPPLICRGSAASPCAAGWLAICGRGLRPWGKQQRDGLVREVLVVSALDSDLQCLQTDKRTKATATCRKPHHRLERGDTLDEDSGGRL